MLVVQRYDDVQGKPSAANIRLKAFTDPTPSFQSRMFTAPPGYQRQHCTHLLFIYRCVLKHLNAHRFSRKSFSCPHLSLWRLEVIPWDDIDEEVELVKLSDGHGDVISLENRKDCKN